MNTTPRIIPNPKTLYEVATFDILTDGKAIDETYQVLSISIVKEINRIPTAHLVLRDGDNAQETFAVSNSDSFRPGKAIHIKLGRDRNNETAFQGIVVKQGIRIHKNGQAELLVECRDAAMKMTIGRHSHYYTKQKDSQVFSEIVSRYKGLTVDAADTGYVHPELVQYHATDWDFLLARAEANGHLVIVEDGTIQSKPPKTDAKPVVELVYGSTMLEFEAEMDARTQWKSVKAQAWNYSSQQLFDVKTDSSSVNEPGNLSGSTLAETVNLPFLELRHSGHILSEELQSWTEATLLRSRLAKNCGRVKLQEGVLRVKPGQMIGFQGVGNRFNGNAFVSAVRHDVGGGKWDTHVQFGLSSEWLMQQPDVADLPAAGLIPPIQGLQVGKVVQLQNDPDGEDRVLVRLPVLDNNAPGIWARVSSLDAGANRGSFFRPEIDDEVIVGFVNNDPRDAIVLGMLHSSAKPAPIRAQDANHEKGFTTRSGMRINFKDDSKTITIDTPMGNSLKIDEQTSSITLTDQNQNSIKMEPTGITIDSKTNLILKAGAMIQLAATTALSIGGASVSAKADGPVSLEGATAKLASPGITEISGSLVKIN